MAIEEAIKFIEDMIYLYRPIGEQLKSWNRLLKLLRWYSSQDLIRREDVQKKFALKHHLVDMLNEIPKAKPPKE